MFQQPLRNFLLVSLLKFFLKIFLVASKNFKAVNLYISLGLSLRQAASAINQFWQVQVSYETIQTWVVSLASKLAPLVKLIPLPLSGIVVIDETYIKVKGKWHYLFTACDGLRGFIISQHLSPHRDVKTALAILKDVVDRYNKREFVFVSDKSPIYDVIKTVSSASSAHTRLIISDINLLALLKAL